MALLKIKIKTLLLVLTLGVTTAATAAKNPYMKWDKLPLIEQLNDINFVVDKCFRGLLINQKSGYRAKEGVVFGTRESYSDVYGKNLYDQIVNASTDHFKVGYYNGTVDNFGIDLDGNAALAVSGLDVSNIRCLLFLTKDGVWIPIAKIGDDNACFNALKNPKPKQDEPGPKPEPKTDNSTTPGTQGFMVIQSNGSGSRELSALEYLGAASIAEAKYKAAQQDGISIFKDGLYTAASLQSKCNTCGTNTNTVVASPGLGVSNVTFAQAQVQPQNTVYYPQQPSGPQEVIVRNKPNALDVMNTVFNGANTFFNGMNTFRGIRIEKPHYYQSGPIYQNPGRQYGPGFGRIYDDVPQVRYTNDQNGGPVQGPLTPVTGYNIPVYMNNTGQTYSNNGVGTIQNINTGNGGGFAWN